MTSVIRKTYRAFYKEDHSKILFKGVSAGRVRACLPPELRSNRMRTAQSVALMAVILLSSPFSSRTAERSSSYRTRKEAKRGNKSEF